MPKKHKYDRDMSVKDIFKKYPEPKNRKSIDIDKEYPIFRTSRNKDLLIFKTHVTDGGDIVANKIKYRLQHQGYQVLIRSANRWDDDHQPMNVKVILYRKKEGRK